jgi:hypothetical protein
VRPLSVTNRMRLTSSSSSYGSSSSSSSSAKSKAIVVIAVVVVVVITGINHAGFVVPALPHFAPCLSKQLTLHLP